METIIIRRPSLCTKLDIWQPRYSSAYNENAERVALLAQYKVQYASPIILVEFTKAKHLAGQRFCIKKEDVMRCAVDSNGKIPCYAVPMSKFSSWETTQEVIDIASNLFNHD